MPADQTRDTRARTNPRALNPYTLGGSAAEMYEQNMVPAIFEPFANDLLDFADLKKGESVLDVACGTGVVARLAWSKVAPTGRVAGLDVNTEMLEVARIASRQQGMDINCVEGDVSKMPFDSGAFDVVLCQHGLQYFPDRSAALNDMHRVLSDRGRIVLNVWRPISFNAGHLVFAEVLHRRVGEEAAATRRAPFKSSDRDGSRTRQWCRISRCHHQPHNARCSICICGSDDTNHDCRYSARSCNE